MNPQCFSANLWSKIYLITLSICVGSNEAPSFTHIIEAHLKTIQSESLLETALLETKNVSFYSGNFNETFQTNALSWMANEKKHINEYHEGNFRNLSTCNKIDVPKATICNLRNVNECKNITYAVNMFSSTNDFSIKFQKCSEVKLRNSLPKKPNCLADFSKQSFENATTVKNCDAKLFRSIKKKENAKSSYGLNSIFSTPIKNLSSLLEHKNLNRNFHSINSKEIFHEYCIIGSGPAGLQMGYFLKMANRDYIIYERNNISGSFFQEFPRHRKLISINKRFTGKHNEEFHLRHDWNSLLSDDPSLLFKHFSKDFFPHADSMVEYLNEYQRKLKLNVEYNVNIRNIRKVVTATNAAVFQMTDDNHQQRTCKYTVVATGLWKPNIPSFKGSEMIEGYETMSLNTDRFEGKNVLILGRGNAAFETADSLYDRTNLVHMVSRSRARLAWNTHYVGDLRALNNGLLDTYQLKSLDGLLEASVEEMSLHKKNGKFFVKFHHFNPNVSEENIRDDQKHLDEQNSTIKIAQKVEKPIDNFSLREGYDKVIRCLGFTFDFDIFHNKTKSRHFGRSGKYPNIKATFESQTMLDLYFTGTIAHSLDYRRSSGGFIHGFRYNVRFLHRMLEWKNHGSKWPSYKAPTTQLLNLLIKRINEASGPYQMFQELADVFIFDRYKRNFVMLEEIPIALIPRLPAITGHKIGPNESLLVVLMEYGPNFSGPDKDTFRSDRATGDPLEAHRSNFLHPVFYYYDKMPYESDILTRWNGINMPKPSLLHHILEDFLTDWTAPLTHILPLRRFLETAIKTDLRYHFAKTCVAIKLTNSKVPVRCKNKFTYNPKEEIS